MADRRLTAVLAAIDDANAKDPNRAAGDGGDRPAELVYAERMSRCLDRLYPDASDLLRIAARGQHIERWTSPRSDFPMTREGYLRWRSELKRYHADRVGALMAEAGYDSDDIQKVKALILKQRLKRDPEAQALEDVVCVVFLEDYFADFAAKHDDAKVVDILRKTWAKMSPHGRDAALTLSLPQEARRLVETALAPANAQP